MRTMKLLVIGLACILAAPAFAAKISSTAKTSATPVVAHKAGKSCAAKCSKMSAKHAKNIVAKKPAAK